MLNRAAVALVGAIAFVAMALATGGCEPCSSVVTACDIRERGCQREVADAVACMRQGGADGALPEITVLEPSEFTARLTGMGEDRDPEAEASYALWNRGLALFGLAPPGYGVDEATADVTAEVAAVYQGETHEILVSAAEIETQELGVELLAHELVHALQHEELDLGRYQRKWVTSLDSALALDALIEGEATFYQLLIAAQFKGIPPRRVDWRRFYAQWQADSQREAELDPAPVALAAMRFPYAFGGGLVTQYWLAGGRSGIDHLFAEPPLSTRAVLFGSPENEVDRMSFEPHSVVELPSGFEEVTGTALGAWVTRVFAGRTRLDLAQRLVAPSALLADRFTVQLDREADVIVASWRARLSDERSAGTWPALAEYSPAVHGVRADEEREVLAVLSEDQLPADLLDLAWRAPADPPSEEEDSGAVAGTVLPGVLACHLRRPEL